ncbi:MAG: hypothetical protein AB7F91_12015 [Parvularculaceae bacterium]
MRDVIRRGWILLIAGVGFFAAVRAGVSEPSARFAGASPSPPVCCIYLIF